jgi:HEAT repeat protein
LPALLIDPSGGRALAFFNLQSRQEAVASEIALLAGRLKSSDEEERRDAALKLASMDEAAAAPALTDALEDSSEKVRSVAATGLASLGDPASIQPLTARLAKEKKSPFMRKTIAYALGQFKSQQATPTLVALLKDKEAEVRGAAAVALGEYEDAAAVGPLTAALTDKSDFVRAYSANALGVNRRAAAGAVRELIRLLARDKDNEVRRQAAIALGRIGDPSSTPALHQAALDEDPYLSQAAREAIRLIEAAR